MGDALKVSNARATNEPEYLVALLEQVLGEVRAVLSVDSGDESGLHPRLLAAVAGEYTGGGFFGFSGSLESGRGFPRRSDPISRRRTEEGSRPVSLHRGPPFRQLLDHSFPVRRAPRDGGGLAVVGLVRHGRLLDPLRADRDRSPHARMDPGVRR